MGENELLQRLLSDDALVEQLTEDVNGWTYEPDASCDDGAWSDDSLLWRDAEIYGQNVRLYAKSDDYDGMDEGTAVGEIYRVEITQ